MMRGSAAPLVVVAVVGMLLSGCVATPAAPTVDRQELTEDLDRAVLIVDQFWRDSWSAAFGGEYTSPKVVGLYDGTDESNAPQCRGSELPPNNAYYCPEEDYLAWDIGVVTSGYQVAEAWAYFVVAHEWGHAIQARIDASLVSEHYELQADCFAGAALAGAVAAAEVNEGDLSAIVGVLDSLQTRSPQSGQIDPAQRVDVFEQGRRGGVPACLPGELSVEG